MELTHLLCAIPWRVCLIVVTMTGWATSARAQFYFAHSNMWVTAQERARVEYRANNYTFDRSASRDDDWWLLHRARVGLGGMLGKWVTVFGELQDAREIGSTRFLPPTGTNPNLEEDTLDVHQAWIEVANYKEFPVGLKVGRQEMGYGDERLIGFGDFNNTGRAFDAVKLRWQSGKCALDLFFANVVAVDNNSFDDKPDWADDFFGLYGTTKAVKNHVWDVYALMRDKDDAAFAGAARQLYTVGTRFAANEKLAPWDYSLEVIGQFGHVVTPGRQFGENSATWAKQEAFASIFNVGYTFRHDWKPRLGIGYDYASGDSDPTDGKSETFDPLYATGHRPLGFIDLFGTKNVHNPHATLSFSPHKRLKLQFDGHFFWLAEARDAWYRSNNSLIRRDVTGNSGRFVGSEIDATATYTPHKRVKVQVGYSHFFTAEFVENTGPSSDADFFYTQLTLNL